MLKYPQKDLGQVIRKYMKNHQTTSKTSRVIPSNRSGINGDIVFVEKPFGADMYAKVLGVWRKIFPFPYNGVVRKINYSQEGYTDSDNSEMTIKLYKLGANLLPTSSGNYTISKQIDVSLSSPHEMKEIPIEGVGYAPGEDLKISFQSPNRDIKRVYFTIELELYK